MSGRRLEGNFRREEVADVRRRRGVVGLSVAAMGVMGVIAAYQVGLVRRLPELPVRGFDSEAVVGSRRAYRFFGVPDGVLGLGSYAVTAGLAAVGGRRRGPGMALALAGKVGFDVVNALRLTWDEWAEEGAFCSYCLVATVCTLGMAPLVVPEARRAVREFAGRFGAGRRTYAS